MYPKIKPFVEMENKCDLAKWKKVTEIKVKSPIHSKTWTLPGTMHWLSKFFTAQRQTSYEDKWILKSNSCFIYQAVHHGSELCPPVGSFFQITQKCFIWKLKPWTQISHVGWLMRHYSTYLKLPFFFIFKIRTKIFTLWLLRDLNWTSYVKMYT